MSPCPYPATIIITPWAPPNYIYVITVFFFLLGKIMYGYEDEFAVYSWSWLWVAGEF